MTPLSFTRLILIVLALCLFFLAAIGVSHPKINLIAAGWFAITLAYLLQFS